MTDITSTITPSEEYASSCRESLHNYDLAFTHLAGYINAVVDPDKVPSVEIAKADLAFAMARLKFAASEVIWKQANVDFNEELQTLLTVARNNGIDSDVEVRNIEGMFSTVTYWAGHLTGILSKFPSYKGV